VPSAATVVAVGNPIGRSCHVKSKDKSVARGMQPPAKAAWGDGTLERWSVLMLRPILVLMVVVGPPLLVRASEKRDKGLTERRTERKYHGALESLHNLYAADRSFFVFVGSQTRQLSEANLSKVRRASGREHDNSNGSAHLPIDGETKLTTMVKRLLPDAQVLGERTPVVVGEASDPALKGMAKKVADHFGKPVKIVAFSGAISDREDGAPSIGSSFRSALLARRHSPGVRLQDYANVRDAWLGLRRKHSRKDSLLLFVGRDLRSVQGFEDAFFGSRAESKTPGASVLLPITARTPLDIGLKPLLPVAEVLGERTPVVVGLKGDRRLDEIATAIAEHYDTRVTIERL
jgi:hypothetical protein